MQTFELWLEFEHWVLDGSDDLECGDFNASVTLTTGERYALNVWTFKFLDFYRRECEKTGDYLGGKYLPPPELFVTSLDRSHIKAVIADLLANGGLKKEWLVLNDS